MMSSISRWFLETTGLVQKLERRTGTIVFAPVTYAESISRKTRPLSPPNRTFIGGKETLLSKAQAATYEKYLADYEQRVLVNNKKGDM